MFEELHPFIVHFPIAFLLLAAALGLLEVTRFRVPAGGLEILLLVGAAGGIAAAMTGNASLETLELSGPRLALAEHHERAGSLTAWLASISFLARLGMAYRRRQAPVGRGIRWGGTLLRWGTLVLVLGAAVAATVAGYRGGSLVHKYGVTRATVPQREPPAAPGYDMFEAAPRQGP